jgi:hypothetical protein
VPAKLTGSTGTVVTRPTGPIDRSKLASTVEVQHGPILNVLDPCWGLRHCVVQKRCDGNRCCARQASIWAILNGLSSNKALADAETKAAAAILPGGRLVSLREAFKDLAELFSRDTDARVSDTHQHMINPLRIRSRVNHHVTGWRKLDGVVDEVC